MWVQSPAWVVLFQHRPLRPGKGADEPRWQILTGLVLTALRLYPLAEHSLHPRSSSALQSVQCAVRGGVGTEHVCLYSDTCVHGDYQR